MVNAEILPAPATGKTAWVRPEALWSGPPGVPGSAVDALQATLGVHRVVATVLAVRGLSDPSAAREFLSPRLDGLLDPLAMRDMDRAVSRIRKALEAGEPILLYGDYDVDGTSSVVVLKKALEILGGTVSFHVPHRLKEGYGMRAEVIERAAREGVRLIISVDTGIRAAEVVRHANQLGIDVIVTDHHLPEADLPPAVAVLNPNRPDCSYPNKHLCGAGVTLKLVQALLAKSQLPESRRAALLESFLKPVAIATVADIVPLIGENRIIVQRGLSGLRNVKNVGLKSLLGVAGFEEGETPSAHQVAFRLAPRINAAGRMASASDVIELFLTEDGDRARDLAEQLDVLNRERQQVESDIVDQIVRECEEMTADGPSCAMVFAGAGWHLGVLGIVASRLVERFSRPVFVLSDAAASHGNEDTPCLAGSGRSIPAFHLLDALESMGDLFRKFGGHKQAAGLTLQADQLEEFRKRFAEFAAGRLTIDDLRPTYTVDVEAAFSELTEDCIRQVLSLGPFGFGNTAPIFLARDAEVAGPPKVLREGKHFSVPIRHNGRMLFCKAWNFGHKADLLTPGARLDVLFQIEDDPNSRKRGYGSWCVVLKDVKRSADESVS
jgi:single-stranded-DNA-specific exonuclease